MELHNSRSERGLMYSMIQWTVLLNFFITYHHLSLMNSDVSSFLIFSSIFRLFFRIPYFLVFAVNIYEVLEKADCNFFCILMSLPSLLE